MKHLEFVLSNQEIINNFFVYQFGKSFNKTRFPLPIT